MYATFYIDLDGAERVAEDSEQGIMLFKLRAEAVQFGLMLERSGQATVWRAMAGVTPDDDILVMHPISGERVAYTIWEG